MDFARAAAALDANFAELLAWYASSPDGEIRHDHELLLTSSGVPFRAINAASRAALASSTASERIAEAIGWLGARNDLWRWLVGPTSRPPDLGDRLLAAGLDLAGESAGMALDLRGWQGVGPLPDGVSIAPVTNEAGLERWRLVQQRGLGLDDASAEAWWIAHRRGGFGAGLPLMNWLANLHGVPVGAAALFVGANVAGIYNVCTVPEARGRGIGAAVTGRRARRGGLARSRPGRARGIGDGLFGLPAPRLRAGVAAALIRPGNGWSNGLSADQAPAR
jgi:GNAT superfamily N-acetyltransferase